MKKLRANIGFLAAFEGSLALFLIVSCGPMKPAKNSAQGIQETGGIKISDAGSTVQMSLWARGPVQASNFATPTVNALDNLDTLDRDSVSLFNLNDPNGTLNGANVSIAYREDDLTSPS